MKEEERCCELSVLPLITSFKDTSKLLCHVIYCHCLYWEPQEIPPMQLSAAPRQIICKEFLVVKIFLEAHVAVCHYWRKMGDFCFLWPFRTCVKGAHWKKWLSHPSTWEDEAFWQTWSFRPSDNGENTRESKHKLWVQTTVMATLKEFVLSRF